MYATISCMSETSFFKNKHKHKPWWHIRLCPMSGCRSEVDKSEETRSEILMAAFDEIYHRGFQSASLGNILKNTETTKGALYHHFANKAELGYAVVDELIYTSTKASWIEPLQKTDDPVTVIQEIILNSGAQMTDEDVLLGCPLNNLAQEMSPIDEGFRSRIKAVYDEWQHTIEEACERGKLAGNIREDTNSNQVAVLFVATLQGCMGVAKSTQSLEMLMQCGEGLIKQLELLRP